MGSQYRDSLTFLLLTADIGGIVSGIGVIKLSSLARCGCIIVAIYSIVLHMIGYFSDHRLFYMIATFDPAFIFALMTLGYLGSIIYFFTRPHVKARFKFN